MKLGEWYYVTYETSNYWILPLKEVDVYKTATAIIVPGGLSISFTSGHIDKYGKRKKKPEDIKVNYRTARNAFKAIFKPS
jgi:hypothetical protein